MINTADGLKAFEEVDGENLKNIGIGMGGLGTGMLALLGAEGMGKVFDMGAAAWNGVKGFFGFETDERSQFEKLADELKEIDKLYVPTIDGEKFAKVVKGIADGLTTFTLIPQPKEGFFSWVGGIFSSEKEGPLESMFKVADRGEDLHKAGIGLDKIASALIRLSDVTLDPKKLDDGINAIVDAAPAIAYAAQDLPSTGSMTNGDAFGGRPTTSSTINGVTTTTTGEYTPTIGENIEFTQKAINLAKQKINHPRTRKSIKERAKSELYNLEQDLKRLKALESVLGGGRVMDKSLHKLEGEVRDARNTADDAAAAGAANGGGPAVINSGNTTVSGSGGGGNQIHARLPSDDVILLVGVSHAQDTSAF